tara:strand:- start:44 stop:1993 length:1950 start_codon:yes stop_codon:yes gene_type:complete
MEDLNLPNNVIYQVIQNLINEEENPILKKTIKYKTDDGEDKEGTIGGILKQGEDHPAYKQARAMVDKDKPEPETKPEEPKIPKTPIKTDKDDGEEKTLTKSTDMFKDVKPGELKQTGDYEIKNLGLKYGYSKVEGVFKPAPGNAGSMLNEIISGEVANILQENPNLSEEELMDTLMNQFGETKLFKQNKGSQRAGGIKKTEIPEGKNPGQYSKLLIAIRAGKRKHKKAMDAASKNNFENSQVKNYYGHKESFKSMINDLEGKEVIGPNGKPVPMEEAIELINSGGGGDNPSDTATLVFDSKSNKVIMLFHSDKDSTDAIIAQSSLRAEAKANEKNIDNLVEQGKITEEEGEQIKGAQIELIEEREKIENELKTVGAEPAKFFLDKVPMSEVVKSATSDVGPDGPDKSKTSTKVKSALNNKNLKSYLTSDNPTEEEKMEAFMKMMSDENREVEPTEAQITLMDRLNRRYASKGAPDVDEKIEEIRNRTIQIESDYIKQNDSIKMDVDGKEVGLGTFLEANTIFKQFHLEAIDEQSETGVHKYPGMFETNHAGLAVDGEVLKKCMPGINNKNDLIKNFEVGDAVEQKGVSGTQKGRTTGSKRIVYAVTAEGERIPMGVKVARSKTGKLGKLQTVYQWSPEFKKCFAKDGKR